MRPLPLAAGVLAAALLSLLSPPGATVTNAHRTQRNVVGASEDALLAKALAAVPAPPAARQAEKMRAASVMSRAAGSGLTQASCVRTADCQAPLQCEEFEGDDVCAVGSTGCVCFPIDRDRLQCGCDNPCKSGEVCTVLPSGNQQCTSTVLANDILQCTPPPGVQPMPAGGLGGLTNDQCNTTADCQFPRQCEERTSADLCTSSDCVCFPSNRAFLRCDCNDPCVQGEVCNMLNSTRNICTANPTVGDPLQCPAPPPSPPGTAGLLTLDPCVTNSDCLEPRLCEEGNSDDICAPGSEGCVCFPRTDFMNCDCDTECPTGEVCEVRNSGATVCVGPASSDSPLQCPNSTNSGNSTAVTTASPVPNGVNSTAVSTASPVPNGDNPTGLTLDACTTDSDCISPRACTEEGSNNVCTSASENCVCFPRTGRLESCNCESECDMDEICEVRNGGGMGCVSPASATNPLSCPTPTATQDVCVDARMLEGFKAEELVYEKHAIAHVLCDETGSCATPGHMVHYKGTTMMMRSYCNIVVCSKGVMEVNSPKYRRGIVVPSKTDGLHFTAFAARYETRMEEAVMAAAVRMGL